MKIPILFGRELTISERLLAWFLAISLVPCSILTGVTEYITSAALETTVRRGLMVISESKAAAIESYLLERRGDVALAGHLPFVLEAITKLGELGKNELRKSPA